MMACALTGPISGNASSVVSGPDGSKADAAAAVGYEHGFTGGTAAERGR